MSPSRHRQPWTSRARSLLLATAVTTTALLGAVASAAPPQETASPAPPSEPAETGTTTEPSTLGLRVSTFLGGRQWDEATDAEFAPDGGLVVVGFTVSEDFPVHQADQAAAGGLVDAFVTKFAPDGGSVQWSTYLGGVDLDIASGLAVDEDGGVYVTGRTASPDFPTTEGALQGELEARDCQGEPCHDAFVTHLDPDGSVLWSTYLGGSADEEGVGIAVDADGRAFVAGTTNSADFPTQNPVQDAYGSAPCTTDLPCPYDTFLATLGPDGGDLAFGTYLGGAEGELSAGVAVDPDGHAHVAGTTRSEDFPTTSSALQESIAGTACGPPPGGPCPDAFVSEVDVDAGTLLASTYLGGSESDRAGGLAVDESGRAVVTGSTRSPDLPLADPAQESLDDASCTADLPEELCSDAFVAHLADGAGELLFSTYLGGQAEDQGLGVTVDPNGNVIVVGRTDSRNFPVQADGGTAQPAFGGYIDGFVTAVSAETHRVLWSTFLGGAEADRALGIATRPDGAVLVAGRTLSPDFPVRDPGAQDSLRHDGEYDAFVTLLG
jgi:Beta-propeller repeat